MGFPMDTVMFWLSREHNKRNKKTVPEGGGLQEITYPDVFTIGITRLGNLIHSMAYGAGLYP